MIRPLTAASTAAGLSAALLATPALAQRLGGAADVDVPWWRLAGALFLCLALAFGGALALRTRLRGAGSVSAVGPKLALPLGALSSAGEALRLFKPRAARLRPVQTVRMSPNLDLCLFTYDGKEFLVAATPHGVTVLSGPDAPATKAEPQ
jgi:hypothetical protein